ncbi:MAG: type II toxin-antitoxin system RelE/ParE family toxin [Candidatus Sumerlaeaceae bacterium]
MGVLSYRELVVSPWRVIYRITEQHVLVVAIIDGRRNVPDLLYERLLME